jgi:transcriptional regulator with XRE-family HTH domain
MSMRRTILEKFGQKVRAERLKQNLTQMQLANKAGISRVYVWMIEKGKKSITLINIEKLAKALKMKISDLIDL